MTTHRQNKQQEHIIRAEERKRIKAEVTNIIEQELYLDWNNTDVGNKLIEKIDSL